MEGLIVILGILVLLAIIAINYLIAVEFYKIAQEKGYNEEKYLWIPFLIGLAGWLLVIALPNRKVMQHAKYTENTVTTEKEEKNIEKINDIIEQVNGVYIRKLENSSSKSIESSIKINGITYSSSDWIADGKIQWFWENNKISHGIKDKTANTPYVLKFELVKDGINVTGFPDDIYNGLYVKK